MYELFLDKPTEFVCNIELEGHQQSEVSARLIVEVDDKTMLFKGFVGKNGRCTIPIREMKELASVGDTGKMSLEIVVGDTYFKPWESEFVVKAERRVAVEVLYPKSQRTSNLSHHAKMLAECFRRNGITPQNSLQKQNRAYIKRTIDKYINTHPELDARNLVNQSVRMLAQ